MFYIFLFTVIIFFSLYFLTNKLSIRIGLYDKNEFKKNNLVKIPLTGGVCIFFSVVLVASIFMINNESYLMILLSFGIFALGVIDDSLNLSFKLRFFVQLVFVALYVIFFNLIITDYSFIKVDKHLIIISFLFTILAIVGTVNSFNFIDGLDGLTSGLFLVSIIFIKLIVFLQTQNYQINELDIFLIAVFCFLLINKQILNFNKIYLGDSGSMFLGFIVAVNLIYYSNTYSLIPPSLVFWFVAVPILDFFAVILIRFLNNKNPMIGDKQHFHHVLLSKGYSENFVLFLLILFSVFFGFFGILLSIYTNSLVSILSFILILIFYVFFRINDLNSKNQI